ncbi:MAG: hypothetical protein MSS16_07355 [Streptococcus orisratti]|uniref:hypothetical protein n=1 Tax=Streptococcus orisratti TaxID=114652 RepID=UPI002354AC3B|nr:hypothetical protein [Streptococcus orisratti]MCI7677878.1 hypothetical protein [Streptococcus orisratti]
MEKLHQQLRQEYDKQEKFYLEKFGEKSLDSVSLWDPLHYHDDWQEVLPDAAKELKNAVETGEPIAPDPPEVIY